MCRRTQNVHPSQRLLRAIGSGRPVGNVSDGVVAAKKKSFVNFGDRAGVGTVGIVLILAPPFAVSIPTVGLSASRSLNALIEPWLRLDMGENDGIPVAE